MEVIATENLSSLPSSRAITTFAPLAPLSSSSPSLEEETSSFPPKTYHELGMMLMRKGHGHNIFTSIYDQSVPYLYYSSTDRRKRLDFHLQDGFIFVVTTDNGRKGSTTISNFQNLLSLIDNNK